jgi:hypothetical protein
MKIKFQKVTYIFVRKSACGNVMVVVECGGGSMVAVRALVKVAMCGCSVWW